MFLAILFLLALSYKFITLYGFIFFESRSNVTNIWLKIYIFFSFTQLSKRRIFLLRHLVWCSPFYIRENDFESCFLFHKKNKVSYMNSFVLKKIHISYFFSVSKVINMTFRFHCHIWCTFSFFMNKNVKIKT